MSVMEVQADPRDAVATSISDMWTNFNNQRQSWLDRVTDTRRYVTAPTTAFTEVGQSRPWKNRTTIPIITQISDNLCAQYMAALMPNDDFFRFEGRDADSQQKANLVEEYLGTKIRLGGFRNEVEKLVRDWVLYGNCFGGVTYVTEKVKSLVDGEEIISFRGPRLRRISPIDCAIDPQAPSFDKSPLIVRSLVPLVDILDHNETTSGPMYDEEALEKVKRLRGTSEDEFVQQYKDVGLTIDGFNDMDSYFSSQYIEVLEYWGDIYDTSSGTSYKNRVVTVVDRSIVLRNDENPAWNGKKPFFHVGWRTLPDNLYGQGPLDNLIGMQYRIDHLENLKADALDQNIHPMWKIVGDSVEDFTPGPDAQVYVGTDGDIVPLRPDMSVVTTNNMEIDYYRNYMEFAAGSPRESAGFRTPGEKTAFEMNMLQAGADKMFIDKVNHFEEYGIKPALALMFELLMRNFEITDVARTFNGDEQSLKLTELTKEHVVADGIFRPMGAKYYAARAKRIQEMQNMLMIAQNPMIAPHFSGVNAGRMLEEELGWERYNIIEENIGTREQLLTQQYIQQMQQMMQKPQQPVEG